MNSTTTKTATTGDRTDKHGVRYFYDRNGSRVDYPAGTRFGDGYVQPETVTAHDTGLRDDARTTCGFRDIEQRPCLRRAGHRGLHDVYEADAEQPSDPAELSGGGRDEWRLGASDERCVFNSTGNLVASTSSKRDAIQIVVDHNSVQPKRMSGDWWVSTHDPLVVIDGNHQSILRGLVAAVADTEKVRQVVAAVVSEHNSHAALVAALEQVHNYLSQVITNAHADYSVVDITDAEPVLDGITTALSQARSGK